MVGAEVFLVLGLRGALTLAGKEVTGTGGGNGVGEVVLLEG